ncbi:MAG: glycoside hydrolase family 140 protein [Cyclobacteriaceae bacterium]
MRQIHQNLYLIIFTFSVFWSCQTPTESDYKESEWLDIEVSENGRFFQYENGDPFFWLGDTGWLLFKKLDRNEAEQYLEKRKQQGFNVVQVMLLHELGVASFQGNSALINGDISRPNVTQGSNPENEEEYDYWDHVEYIVDLAAEKGIFMGLVPVWGSPVSADKVSVEAATVYAQFLVERFASKPNIIWLNGGDVVGDRHMPVWQAIGNTLDSLDDRHLITYHPRGRRMSSEWFHNETWLDFNMFQSGHRTYDQDTARDSHRFGPDNWKYVDREYSMKPFKPTLDGEPSYEEIPYGLHDPSNPYWEDHDLRRYAYWSVFAGGAGFTYGHNSVMQFYNEGDEKKAYGAKSDWRKALDYLGAEQMRYLKDLMLSKSYFDRVPDKALVADQGKRYEYQVGTKGKRYALIYTYTGRDILANMGRIEGEKVSASWFDPRTGSIQAIGVFDNQGQISFDPPGEPENGNDWVLVLESI